MRLQLLSASTALLFVISGCVNAGPTTRPAAQQESDFPYKIAFELGASQFQPGDQITITEVRGTSKDMQSGICRITGTYTLASHDDATLAASVTARDAADGRSHWNQAQTMKITKGKGTFTLFLPISISGWPHVSFYGTSSDFGGTFVGTGDGVLSG